MLDKYVFNFVINVCCFGQLYANNNCQFNLEYFIHQKAYVDKNIFNLYLNVYIYSFQTVIAWLIEDFETKNIKKWNIWVIEKSAT